MFKIRGHISKNFYISLAVLSFVFVFILWLILSNFEFVDPVFLPSPSKVWTYFLESLKDGTLVENTLISVQRICFGVLIAVVLGVPLGLLCGTFKFCEALIRPLCEFIRYMPVPAFTPLVMVWVGIGEEAKVTLLFIGIFFQLILMIADDAMSVSEDLLCAGYTLGTTKWQTVTKILIPAMLPRALDTLRMMIGWAWTYLVVAEMVAANNGLGYSIMKAQRFLKTDAIFTGILVIGILGLITDRALDMANKILFHWREGN
ncbi:MAG: ABC transporter permease [Clostridia bacterium]|nr:ABC transporter permease [Clostridia bacterium]